MLKFTFTNRRIKQMLQKFILMVLQTTAEMVKG